jgi:putative MFS transporter
VPELGWQSIFLIGGVPCIVVALLVARLPESPRWLLSKGRVEEAEAIVRQMEARILGPIPSVNETPEAASVQPTRWGEVLSENYRKRTLVIWALWFSAYIVANSLNNWLPTLYNTVYHLALRQSLRAASLTNVTQVTILLGCAFLIDRIGRKNWTLASFAAAAVCLAIVAITGARSVTTVMILATLSYGVIGSANAVLYLYTPEVYPTRMRAIGTGLATAWLRVASAIGPAIVGAMVSAGGVGSVFWMFTAGAVAGAFSALGMIETRGRRLEQIAK